MSGVDAGAVGGAVVSIAGVFPPGAVVELVRVLDESVMRAESGTVVGRRVVDEVGLVGFDGLVVGDRFFACGYVAGVRRELRCRAEVPSAVTSGLAQPPVQGVPTTLGTDEVVSVEPGPAAPGVSLPVGAPSGVLSAVSGVPEPAVEVAPELWLDTLGPEVPIDSAVWVASGLQTPATVGGDGSVVEPRVLYSYVGGGLGDGPVEGWERYEGPTEPVAVQPEPAGVSLVEQAQPEASVPVDSTVQPSSSVSPPGGSGSSPLGAVDAGGVNAESSSPMTPSSAGGVQQEPVPSGDVAPAGPAQPEPAEPPAAELEQAQPEPAASAEASASAGEVTPPAAATAESPAVPAQPEPVDTPQTT